MTPEFVFEDVDGARAMFAWLAKRRRMTLSALVKSANMRSQTLVNFVSPSGTTGRTNDTNFSYLITVTDAHDHDLLARPAGGKHLQLRVPGAVPLEIRGAGGDVLEIPLTSTDSVRTLGATLVVAMNESLSSMCELAGVSQGFASFANGTARTKDIRVRPVTAILTMAGFELVARARYANMREARLIEKLSRR